MQRYLKYIIPSVVFFGYTFGFRMFYAFAPLHLKGLGLPQAAIGILMAVYPFSLIVLSVPIGLASDRFSPRTWAVAGLFAMSGSVWSLHFSNSFYTALLSFCGIGIGSSLYTVGAATLYFKSLGNARQGVKLALYNSLAALGYGTGPFTGGLILSAMNGNMRALFPAAAVILLPFAFLMLASQDARLEPVRLSSYLEDLRNPRVRFLLLIVFLFSLHFGVENVCYSLFLKYRCGVPESRIGLVFLFVGLTIAPAEIFTGIMADRVRRADGLMALGMAVSGLFNASMFFVDSLWPVIALRVCHAIGDGIFLLYLDVSVSRLFPARRVGAPIGLNSLVKMSGMMCGSLLAGLTSRYDIPFLAAGIVVILLSPFVYRFFRTI